MKKTTTINLNSIVYNIDEDACSRLSDYLDDLRSRLDNDVADEVMEDIEARVGELFSKNMNQYKTVVVMADVERVIDTLGDPESFGPASHFDEEKRFDDEMSQTGPKRRRKFYRDADNKILGGIAAGTAVALNWDVTLVRVLFFVCLLASFGWAMLVYLLLWCIVPEARTVAQKLEMQGIEPSAQNISDYSQRYQQEDASCSRPDGNSQSAFGTILKVVGGLILIPILFVFILVAVVVVATLIWCLGMGMVVALPGVSTFFLVSLAVSGILSIIIPLVYLVWLIAKKLMKDDTHIKRSVFVTWLFVWLLSLVTASGLIMYAATHMSREDIKNLFEADNGHGIYVDDDDEANDDNMISEVRCDSMPFHTINVEGSVDMEMVSDSVWFVEVRANGNRLRNVETMVSDEGELTIRFVNQKNRTAHTVIHYATPVKVMNFRNGTAAEVDDFVTEDTLHVNCKNGTALDMSGCKVKTLFLDARNGSAVKIDGEAENVAVMAKKGAAVDIHKLKVSGRVVKDVDIASDIKE